MTLREWAVTYGMTVGVVGLTLIAVCLVLAVAYGVRRRQ